MAGNSLEDDTESLYGVDRSGRVWFMNEKSIVNDTRKSITSLRQWLRLPNPTRVDIKRLSSRSGVLWGISSGHQIHLYVHKTDISIRVREESWENQRWIPIHGFGSHLLPTDRPHFSSEDGLVSRAKDNITLPSESWLWESDWQFENTYDNQLLEAEGWTYAVDFPASYAAHKSWNSCVRRRKWFRTRKFIGFDKWQPIEPIHKDHTQEPFTDVCVNNFGTTHSDISCVWAVTVLGQVYFRNNVTLTNPEGTSWIHVPIEKGLEACQLTVSANGTPFVVTWTGSCIYRSGLTPHNLSGKRWVERNGPPGGLLQLSAGEKTLWGITRDRKCWALKGNLQECIAADLGTTSTTFDWVEIPGKMRAISVNKSDQVILAVSDEDNVVFARFGITSVQKFGQGWKDAFPFTSWDTISNASSEISASNAYLDQVDQSVGGDNISQLSIRPDYPDSQGFQFDQDLDSAEVVNVSLCWIDGGCLSLFSSGSDGDLEVGSWREEILSGLQSQATRENFSYPSALEDTLTPWSKSTSAKMQQHRKKSVWISGELQILNNDTLVFHKDLQHTWMCSMNDILSTLRIRGTSLSFTLRIRNAIEAGVAELVSFKFSNEKEQEDWYVAICELSVKNSEEFMLKNFWLTTTYGELLECGWVKIADTPLETEVIRPSDTDSRTHYSLIKGFLPGSVLRIDITIPIAADRFSFNLEGRTFWAFHFNPRFSTSCVVRNSVINDEWGDEERDGVFPFIRGNSYGITIECTDSHLITTIKFQRKQFIFTYRHRVPPKFITSFNSAGDVSICGIRYDPKSGEETSQPEFVTKSIPGHFWKVEAATNGFVWAIGYDSKVWVYTAKDKRQGDGRLITVASAISFTYKILSDHCFMFSDELYNAVTDDREFYIYENQRWNPLSGFGHHGLPTDRSPWSDESGKIALEKDSIKLPSNMWSWIADWEIDYSVRNGVDKSGWQYAIDFPASYHSSKRFNDFVRRRRWKRICRYTVIGPWVQVTGVKLIDLSIHMNDECEWEVLGASQNGEGVVRCGITTEVPTGTHWQLISSQNPLISISGWFGQKCWAVGKNGFAYICYLLPNWQMLDRPEEAPLKCIRVGPNGVWALSVNNVLYRRTDILPIFPEGKEWAKVCEGVVHITLAPDGSVWVLFRKGEVFASTLAKRVGINQSNPHGIGWETIAEGPWSYLTLAGSITRNR